MSIATKRGDGGQTSLIGGDRVWKSDPCVEAYGEIDELGAHLGFARSICADEEVRKIIEAIQRELFTLSSVIATISAGKRKTAEISQEMIDALTAHIDRIEQTPGIIRDWSLAGEDRAAAAIDIARTVCRRAERALVRLMQTDERPELRLAEAYINRLSDLLWLLGRLVEVRSGIDSNLRSD